ncbi:PaaI family thioesterase [Lysobacter sp. K5869]|uniref:PaaI family thioesterase n=1 Tax=Lysobacter sp. K5869 TaxID=2820808 RepID=UPI001C062469|nr:PaaI family thioesterase [Lysobacter sp. K5869]QWP77096.1 PaaI family thioesterase [Lysobacter sp. K5869]
MQPDNTFWAMVDGRLPLPAAATTLGWCFHAHNPADRSVSVSFEVGDALTNPLGQVHGGMLAAMLDDCMGPAIYAELPPDRIAVTVESKTVFVQAARPGRIFGYGRIEHWRGQLCFAAGRLTDEQGRVLATATATYRIGHLRWRGWRVPGPLVKHLLRRQLRKRAAAKALAAK